MPDCWNLAKVLPPPIVKGEDDIFRHMPFTRHILAHCGAQPHAYPHAGHNESLASGCARARHSPQRARRRPIQATCEAARPAKRAPAAGEASSMLPRSTRSERCSAAGVYSE